MKNSKKVFGNAGQSTTEVKKPHKHDANLQKNSTLYFQIGLILCLLGTYSLFEMRFQDHKVIPESIEIAELATIDVAPDYQVEVVEPEKLEPEVTRSTTLTDTYEEIDDDKPVIEAEIFTPDTPKPSTEPVVVGSISDDNDIEDEDIVVPFKRIEKVPVYPGCERKKTNEDKKKCMSDKITKLIGKKFNTELASEYGLTGVQRIYAQFTIDKNGDVVDVKARAPHSGLEKEAQRVINKIPQMKPGYQRNVAVGVVYSLPITFQVRD